MDLTSAALGVAAAALALIGVLVGSWLARRGDKELDRWRRREETMRLLRWAVEAATSDNVAMSAAGLAVLDELAGAELLQPEDQGMVEAVIDVVTSAARAMAYAGLGDHDYSEVQMIVEEGSNG